MILARFRQDFLECGCILLVTSVIVLLVTNMVLLIYMAWASLLISIGCLLTFFLIPKVKKYTIFHRLIDTNQDGFSIISDIYDTKEIIRWDFISSVRFDKNKLTIFLELQSGEYLEIHTMIKGFYTFLYSIPESVYFLDREYVNQLFTDLSTCQVCGLLAISPLSSCCLSCDNFSYDIDHEEDKKEIIKEQLFYFSSYYKENQLVDFHIAKKVNPVFEYDLNWKPSVTEDQVRFYALTVD